MSSSEIAAADALRRLALGEDAKRYVLENPGLYGFLYGAAERYVGGQSLTDCLAVAEATNRDGHAVTIDFMGESTRDAGDAREAADEFVRVAEAIAERGLRASVSLDLSHIGLMLGEDFCVENASAIASTAKASNIEVMISAEGVERTAEVLNVHGRLCEQFDNIGLTVQAYLLRTHDDLDAIAVRSGKVRLVKGAFAASETVAMPRGEALDAAYLECVQYLAATNRACSVASHDPALIDRVSKLRGRHDRIEFEMLRGVTTDRLDDLRDQGFATRVYVPYGREWFLYLMNRLAENPPSLFNAIASAAHNRTARSADAGLAPSATSA